MFFVVYLNCLRNCKQVILIMMFVGVCVVVGIIVLIDNDFEQCGLNYCGRFEVVVVMVFMSWIVIMFFFCLFFWFLVFCRQQFWVQYVFFCKLYVFVLVMLEFYVSDKCNEFLMMRFFGRILSWLLFVYVCIGFWLQYLVYKNFKDF